MRIKKLLSAGAFMALALLGFNASAGNIDANAARMAAKNFINQRVNAHSTFKSPASVADVKLVHAEASSVEGNAYYVFNIQGGGWVIAAGDDRAKQILAYGENGSIDMKNMPDNMKGYLKMLRGQIETAQAYKGKTAPAKSPKLSAPVGPLLKTTWGQGEPLNRLCPMNGTKRTSVGCGPLAMAQIMYYWKYPTELPAMTGYSVNWNIQVPDLPATTIDYSKMIDAYHVVDPETGEIRLGTFTEEQASEVSKLARYCGQACKARYGNSNQTETGSYTYDQRDAFYLFGFNSGAQLIGKDPSYYNANFGTKYTIEEWIDLICVELEANRPIPYHDLYEGHAWVLDGVDADGKFHMNWGFYGKFNGWFEINALIFHPYGDSEVWDFSQGSNGGNEMIIGMYPYEGYVIPGDDPQPEFTRGDVDNNGEIKIADVTALINYLLSGDDSVINLLAADCDQNGEIKIADVTALINYLLSGAW